MEEQSRETVVQSWGQGLGSPSSDTHNNIFELFADTEMPTRFEEKLMICCPQVRRPRSGWNPKDDDADSHLTSPPTSQKNVQELITPSLNHYYQTFH